MGLNPPRLFFHHQRKFPWKSSLKTIAQLHHGSFVYCARAPIFIHRDLFRFAVHGRLSLCWMVSRVFPQTPTALSPTPHQAAESSRHAPKANSSPRSSLQQHYVWINYGQTKIRKTFNWLMLFVVGSCWAGLRREEV